MKSFKQLEGLMQANIQLVSTFNGYHTTVLLCSFKVRKIHPQSFQSLPAFC